MAQEHLEQYEIPESHRSGDDFGLRYRFTDSAIQGIKSQRQYL